MALPWFVPRNVLSAPGRPGAGDRILVGVIGTGVRGKHLIGNLPEAARVVAICDCYRRRISDTLKPAGKYAPLLARFAERDGPQCATYQDYRQMIGQAKLDAVAIAAPIITTCWRPCWPARRDWTCTRKSPSR